MNRTRLAVHAEAAQRLGITGKGVTVAVLDTGISPVKAFTVSTNRILAFQDFINYRTQPYDDNGHGTHVSGIVAGNGFSSHGLFTGIAPDCNIVALKILDENGKGNSPQALAAIQWIMDNRDKYNIRAANFSIGINEKKNNPALSHALSALWDAGVAIVAAAQNIGSSSVSLAVIPKEPQKLIIAGSSDDIYRTEQPRLFFSPKRYPGPPDIYAPGTDIFSCLAPESSLAQDRYRKKTGTEYVCMSGTSMATPVITGAIALLCQKYSHLTPDQIRFWLKRSSSNGRNGMLNLEKLLSGRF